VGEKSPLKSFLKEINKIIGDDNQILSLEILLPDSIEFKNIKSKLCLLNDVITWDSYKTLINVFLQADVSLRSLYFLKYCEPYKYKGVRPKFKKYSNSIIKNDEGYAIEEGTPFPKEEADKAPQVKDPNNVNPFWDAWVSEIKNTLNIDTYSTLWSYIYLQEKDFICSAYIIFAKPIEDKNSLLSVINKKIQDYLYEQTLDFFRRDIERHAIRAAISQVMARNTSHNIGAHVMNKLVGNIRELDFLSHKKGKNYLSKIELKNNIHRDIIKRLKNDSLLKSLSREKKITYLHNEIALAQIAIFNNYVKCRMDYLADISFGTPLMQTNKYVYGELFTEFDKVRLLLEHISGLDNFQFKIEFKRNGNEFVKDENGNILNDLLVAIPNDILGTQAFYNILENIIRNTAKHSNKEALGGKPVIFTVNFIIDIEESEEHKHGVNRVEIKNVLTEFIAVEVYDNIPVEKLDEKLDLEESDIKEFNDKKTALPKSDKFSSYIDKLVFSQNKKLNEDILQENKLRSYSLGLVEMDASAAYLRKRPVEYINHKSYDIHYDEWWSRDTEENEGNKEKRGTNCRHFLKAFKKSVEINDEKGNRTENYLGYRFFLHRPAVVLVVTNELKNDKVKRDKLQKEGIWIITPQEFEKELTNDQVYPHEFLLYGKEELRIIKPFLDNHRTFLPVRILEFTNDELKKYLSDKPANGNKIVDEWENECWKRWESELKTSYNVMDKVVIHTSLDCCSEQNIESCNCPMEGKYNAVMLDHGKKDYNTYRFCRKVNYLDDLSNKSYEKLPRIKATLSENKFSHYRVQLLNNPTQYTKIKESALSKILVIDERVQNQIDDIYFAEGEIKILYHEVYNRSGIIIPDKPKDAYYLSDESNLFNCKFNLSANDIDKKYGESLQKYIKHYVNAFKKTDFILIHYSILERIYEREPNKIYKINEFLNEIAIHEGPQIIVTSGRGGGALTELSSKVRFVNLSSAISALVEIKSKYFSNYLLHSSRKNKSKN